ncbi:MAG TPA: phasin family protein [Anaeromyxobacteraceae bacterium]|jgi:polyhydroxyalkanoate synthesis regulator phasin|nr:phasin family protein [Anaeromyxobacteraceae bacterium]
MADIQEMFKEAWSQALVGLNAAEAEAEKVLQKLVDAAGLSPEDMKKHAREFGERLGAQRQELERTIDDAVRRASQRFKVPTREDLNQLKQRLDAVDERLDALAREKEKRA